MILALTLAVIVLAGISGYWRGQVEKLQRQVDRDRELLETIRSGHNMGQIMSKAVLEAFKGKSSIDLALNKDPPAKDVELVIASQVELDATSLYLVNLATLLRAPHAYKRGSEITLINKKFGELSLVVKDFITDTRDPRVVFEPAEIQGQPVSVSVRMRELAWIRSKQ